MKIIEKSFFYILLILLVLGVKAQQKTLEQIPYFFDVGNKTSNVDELAIQLTENDTFTSTKGYGLLGDYMSFTSKIYKQNSIRDDLTYDGIAAKELSFQINLPSGEWYFTFWLEAGYEDIPTSELFINNNKHDVTWHEIKVGAEGRTSPIKNYRVIHTQIQVENNKLTFTLKNPEREIQLLAFSFCPPVGVESEEHSLFARIIKQAGKYKSKVILDELARGLKNSLLNNLEDAYLFYWYQQVSLLAEGERYLNTQGWEWGKQLMGLSIFDRMHQALFLFDTQIENFDTTDYPLKERALWQRGKLSYDLVLERGGEYQRKIFNKDLPKLFSWYPDDDNLAMLNGQKIRYPHHCDKLCFQSEAPEWALLQHEAICRLSSEIDWWVNHRQDPNGELGGKIGDDVEILREWSPLLFLGDDNTRHGWRKLANAAWNDPKVYKGFSARPIDVEHASEFISDSTPELLLLNHDEKVKQILSYTVDYFENLWTHKNSEERRYFKSSWYSSSEVDETPPKNRDLGYNTRTVKPLNYLAWAERNPHYIKLLSEWADGWLYAAMSTKKNKPKGIIPASIRYYDESINGDEPTWFNANMFWTYFNWSHDAGTQILDQLLFTYTLTNKVDYLQPIEYALKLVEKKRDKLGSDAQFEEGREDWAASILISKSSFWSVVQRWRILTGNDNYDELVEEFGTPYIKYFLTKNEKYLAESLTGLAEQLRHNVPLRTNLVLHTDRVRINGADNLRAMITGSGGSGNSPYYIVTWEEAEKDIAILVEDSSPTSLFVKVFSFSDNEKTIVAKPWNLDYGVYNVIIESEGEKITNEVSINKPGQDIQLRLAPGTLANIKFIRNEN